MMDLNDLRVFEKIASLRSFSAAARALGLPKSSVSRGVARLEKELGTRPLQRTTRDVALTEAGIALAARCADILASIGEAVELVDGFVSAPRGLLRISAGVGFGVHVLSLVLPGFLERYPRIEVSLRLGNRSLDLVSDGTTHGGGSPCGWKVRFGKAVSIRLNDRIGRTAVFQAPEHSAYNHSAFHLLYRMSID
jgi:DNA-binding transcriptional LysR family regulator